MRVALYARVSTDRQEQQQTIGSQLEALHDKVAAEGWQVELNCTDDGYSGTRLDRPGLDRVRDAAAARLIDAVVVLCPDRLARNYVHQALVLDELGRFGVPVIFLEGGLADSPHGRLIAQVQAAVAEFERTKIVERNRPGKLWRARQGAVVSGDVPFGYRKLPASNGLPPRLEIHDEEAAVVRQVFNWHANEGLSVRQIAIRLMEAGVPSPRGNRIWRTSSLDRLLHNEAYTGTMYFNRYNDLPHAARLPRHDPGHRPIRSERPREEWIAVSVPAIIDLDSWTRSQTRHGVNARFSPRHVGEERYLLRYLVRCGECGAVRHCGGRNRAGREDHYYRCQNIFPMHLRDERLRCSQPSARANELDELVWAEVVKHLRHPELIARACAAAPDDTRLAETHRQLTELRTQHRRLVDAYQADAITLADLKARQGPLTERIAELDQASTRDQQRRITKADLKKRIDEFAHQVNGNLEAMTFEQRQQLIRTVLDRVILTQERVELCFKIPIPQNRKEGRSRQSRVSDQLRSHRHDRRIAGLPAPGEVGQPFEGHRRHCCVDGNHRLVGTLAV
jgi:site-specific DNA recombinase